MKVVKLAVGVVLLGVSLLACGYLLPGDYKVERSIIIDASPAEVYPWLVDLKRWDQWGIWFRNDPNAVINYSGPDRAIGMRSSWESPIEGSGELEIIALQHNHRLVYELHREAVNDYSVGEFVLTKVPQGTRLSWSDSGQIEFNPITRLGMLSIESKLAPEFEIGLQNIKTLIENSG